MTFNTSDSMFAEDDAERKWCGVMTASRRTFCLLVTFDLILTFILWGVYAKVGCKNF
jgi:Cholesterol-capturing domain